MNEYIFCAVVLAIVVGAFRRRGVERSRLWRLLQEFDTTLDRFFGLPVYVADEPDP